MRTLGRSAVAELHVENPVQQGAYCQPYTSAKTQYSAYVHTAACSAGVKRHLQVHWSSCCKASKHVGLCIEVAYCVSALVYALLTLIIPQSTHTVCAMWSAVCCWQILVETSDTAWSLNCTAVNLKVFVASSRMQKTVRKVGLLLFTLLYVGTVIVVRLMVIAFVRCSAIRRTAGHQAGAL